MTEEHVIVSDQECEELLLGTLISDGGQYTNVAEFLDEECFYHSQNKEIFNAIKSVCEAGQQPDLVTVMAQLNKVGSLIEPFTLSSIASKTTYYDLQTYALRLRELKIRRRMWEMAQKMSSVGVSETDDIDEMRQFVIDGINGIFDKDKNVFTLEDSIKSLKEIMKQNMMLDSEITGTPTGFTRIDRKGGLQKSDLIIIAGETSQGKTSLAMTILKNAIQSKAKAAMYSLEMTRHQLAARMLSSISGVPSSSILYSRYFNDYELSQIDKAEEVLPGDNLYFDDSSTANIESILISIRSMKAKYDIDGAVIDFLQIVNVSDGKMTREQQLGTSARRLKNLAKELNIWIVVLSQLSRNSGDPIPTLGRLRDSGQIAEAADVVMLVYRPEYYHKTNYPSPYEDSSKYPVQGTAMIDIAKGRNIGTFKFIVDFDARTTTFSDWGMDEEKEQEYVPMPVEEDAPF